MLELFRSEVESHAETLTSSLLVLEQDPSATDTLESMMRAAHSIKGAARIVRIDLGAEIAHEMEDCFVAAQKGELSITPDNVDLLLQAVDLLLRISATTRDPDADWASLQEPVAAMVSSLHGLLQTGVNTRPFASSPSARAVYGSGGERLEGKPLPAIPPGAVSIVCPKVLDAPSAERSRIELLAALSSGAVSIDINLAATTDLDAVGLAFLVAARSHVSAQSGTLRFSPISTEMQTILQIVGLDVGPNGVSPP